MAAPPRRGPDPRRPLAGAAGNIRDGVRRRFYTLVDTAGFDEERARAWVVVRVVQQASRDPMSLTKYVALAKAVQD